MPARPRSLALRLLKWGLLLVLLVGAGGAATVAGLFWYYGADPDLPRLYALRDYQPKQTTRILSADGKMIGELYEERRTYVSLDEIAPIMVQAVIDAEDADFRKHGGLDYLGMVRALWVNLRAGRTRQGASTITQQVVKTFLLSPERTLRRKVQEILLARRIETALTKDEILTLYLNQIYFGHGRYGVEEAARFYFGKRAKDLNAAEAALLAGLPQSPERLSPLKHPEAAKARQGYVLEQMARHGHLDAAEAKRWIDEPIRVVKYAEPFLDAAPEFVEVARKELIARHGDAALARLGTTVQTTVDLGLQRAARAALERGLAELDARHGYRGAIRRLSPAKATARLRRLAKALPDGGPRAGETYEGIVVTAQDDEPGLVVDLGGWKGWLPLGGTADARYNPGKKKPSARFAKGDLIRVRLAPELGKPAVADAQGALALELGPQGALVAIDPATRRVVAMVGGAGFELAGFNRALRARRQPGSAFKPIVFAAALDGGSYTPASIVNDAPEVYALWKPKNYERGQFRGPVRLRTALALSINTVAIRVLHDIGPARAIELARALGIESELPSELSLALGSGVVTPLELTNAYATFAAEGRYAAPVFLDAVGEEKIPPPAPRPALRPEIAFLTTSLMRSVVEEGTARAAKKLRRELAGKTGTSNGGKDAWFVGYTPELAIGVWVGFDDMRPLGRGEAGGKAALPIWIEAMKAALRGKGARSFVQPPGIVVARIDKRTGLLASPQQPEADVVSEVFLEGTAPVETAPAPDEADPSTFVLEQMADGMDDEVGATVAPPEAGGE